MTMSPPYMLVETVEVTRNRTTATNLCFALITLFLVLNFVAVPALLEQFIAYRTSGGSALEKIHPATYFAVITYCLLIFWAAGRNINIDRSGHFSVVSFFLLFLFLSVTGKFYFAATMLDIIVAPAIITFAMGALDRTKLITVGRVFIFLCLINLPIVFFEFASKTRLYSYGVETLYFRPAGLFQHPVIAGPLCYCAMLLAISGIIPRRYQLLVLITLLAEILFLAVRIPLLVGLLIFGGYLVKASTQRYGILIVLGVLAVAPFAFYSLIDSDIMQRVMERGVWDESANARVTIYDAISYLTDFEFLSGVDPARVEYYIQSTGNKFNESFFIIALFNSGIFFATAYTAAVLIFFNKWMRADLMFAVCILAVAASSNGLATKGPTVAALAITGYIVYALKKKYPADKVI